MLRTPVRSLGLPLVRGFVLSRPSPFAPVRIHSYSTSSNPYQVFGTFSTPLSQFVQTISRIARIITCSVVGLGVVGLSSYELTHQYVEHFAMPALGGDDSFGWAEQAMDEAWNGTGKAGTDPRLGVKARHALRSAWMCVNWGGGISPGLLFGGRASTSVGLGRTAVSSISSARNLHVNDGMILAIKYMDVAIQVARKKGLTLPDYDAQDANVQVDPTALALLTKLAAIKERQGSRGALTSAIQDYERIYDVVERLGKKERLVRTANKIGDLNKLVGRREEAELWLNRAVHVAGATVPMAEVALPEEKSGWFRGLFNKSATPIIAPTEMESPPIMEATPALTRSLLSTLLSLSALYAQSPTTLPSALQIQSGALQLASLELTRPTTSPESLLHNLWLQHTHTIFQIHLAETLYALPSKDLNLSKSHLLSASAGSQRVLSSLPSPTGPLSIFTKRLARDAATVYKTSESMYAKLN